MKKIIIIVQENVAQWAKVYAAKHDTSVSAMLGSMLTERMESERNYLGAMKQFCDRQPTRLSDSDEPHPQRDSLYV